MSPGVPSSFDVNPRTLFASLQSLRVDHAVAILRHPSATKQQPKKTTRFGLSVLQRRPRFRVEKQNKAKVLSNVKIHSEITRGGFECILLKNKTTPQLDFLAPHTSITHFRCSRHPASRHVLGGRGLNCAKYFLSGQKGFEQCLWLLLFDSKRKQKICPSTIQKTLKNQPGKGTMRHVSSPSGTLTLLWFSGEAENTIEIKRILTLPVFCLNVTTQQNLDFTQQKSGKQTTPCDAWSRFAGEHSESSSRRINSNGGGKDTHTWFETTQPGRSKLSVSGIRLRLVRMGHTFLAETQKRNKNWSWSWKKSSGSDGHLVWRCRK